MWIIFLKTTFKFLLTFIKKGTLITDASQFISFLIGKKKNNKASSKNTAKQSPTTTTDIYKVEEHQYNIGYFVNLTITILFLISSTYALFLKNANNKLKIDIDECIKEVATNLIDLEKKDNDIKELLNLYSNNLDIMNDYNDKSNKVNTIIDTSKRDDIKSNNKGQTNVKKNCLTTDIPADIVNELFN